MDPTFLLCRVGELSFDKKSEALLPKLAPQDLPVEPIGSQNIHDRADRKLIEERNQLRSKFRSIPYEVIRMHNPFEMIGTVGYSTRAAIKLANMDAVFKLTGYQNELIEVSRLLEGASASIPAPTGPFLYCDIAGAPGSWTEYIQRRRNRSRGFGISLRKDSGGLPWDLSLLRDKTSFEIVDFEGGDIIKGWKQFVNHVKRSPGGYPSGVNLVVADGGVDLESLTGGGKVSEEVYAQQEQKNFSLIFHEHLAALGVIAENGKFVCKVYDVHTEIMEDLLYLVSFCFGKKYLFKPASSRPANSEAYMIWTDAKPLNDAGRVSATSFLETASQQVASGKIGSRLLGQEIPQDFRRWLWTTNNFLLRGQIRAAQEILELVPPGSIPRYHARKAILLWDLNSDEPRGFKDIYATKQSTSRIARPARMRQATMPRYIGIARSYQEWSLSKELLRILLDNVPKDPRSQNLAVKAFERWLINMTALPCRECDTEWSPIFKIGLITEPNNAKFVDEMMSDSLFSTRSEATELVTKMLGNISIRLRDPPQPEAESRCDQKKVEYKDFKASVDSVRVARFINEHECSAVIRMLMRYDSLAGGGRQLGLQKEVFDILYSKFGVRNEGFASPLNSKMIDYPGGSYYSAFPDTDAEFGSKGDFFASPLSTDAGGWQVNPPFTEDILLRATKHVLEGLVQAHKRNRPMLVFFVSPSWRDAEFYRLLSTSDFKKKEIVLESGKYHYETPAGEKVVAPFPSIHFLLANYELPPEQQAAIPDLVSK